MELLKETLSCDGYINEQRKMTNFMYGPVLVALSGCGPIAAYNALKAIGKEQSFEKVLDYFNKTTIRCFRMGSNAFQIFGVMHKYKVKVKVHFRKELFNQSDVGILWYKHSLGWHYIMYKRIDNSENYYFYNAGGIGKPIMSTMGTFIREHTVSKLCAIFELKGA